MEQTYQVHLYKNITFAGHQGPDYTQDSDEEYSFKLYHNVELSFVPFIGLSISYNLNEQKFNQGWTSDREKQLLSTIGRVDTFESGKITHIRWDFQSLSFKCTVEPRRLKENDHLGRRLYFELRDNWFPLKTDDVDEIDKLIKDWETKKAEKRA